MKKRERMAKLCKSGLNPPTETTCSTNKEQLRHCLMERERELACIIMGRRGGGGAFLIYYRTDAIVYCYHLKNPNYHVHRTTNGQTIDKKALRWIIANEQRLRMMPLRCCFAVDFSMKTWEREECRANDGRKRNDRVYTWVEKILMKSSCVWEAFESFWKENNLRLKTQFRGYQVCNLWWIVKRFFFCCFEGGLEKWIVWNSKEKSEMKSHLCDIV